MTQTDEFIPLTEMHPTEKEALRAAARLATNERLRLYTTAVGKLISKELHAAADFGYRLGSEAPARLLAAEVFAERDRRLGEAS